MKVNNHRQGIIAAATWECRSDIVRLWLIFLLLLSAVCAKAQEIPVRHRFSPGEEVQYELYFKWGLLIEKVYKMRDTIDCHFTPDMLLLRSEKRVNENDYYLIDDIRFSYDRKKILAHSHRYTPTRTKIDTMLVTEDPHMFDMLGATMYLRSLDWDKMKSGESFPFQVAIGRERINISFRYTGQQIVERSETLKYRTRHFYIDIYDDAFTQSKEAAEIWIGDDENHIPIKIRAKLKIGAAEVYYKSSKGLRYPLTSRVEIKRR